MDVWSNHACSGGSVNSFLPGLRTCTPWQRQWHQGREGEPTGIMSKATKDQSSGCYWKRQGVHPSLGTHSEGAVGPSFFKGPVIFPVLNDSQSHPEENRQRDRHAKLGDVPPKWRKTD